MRWEVDNMPFEMEEIIEHYGVKGMKWGVRRSKEQLQSASRERSWSNKDQSKMSKKQLKRTVQRLQNENDFKRTSSKLQKSYNVKAVKKALTLKLKDSRDLAKTGLNYKKQYRNRHKLSDEQLKKKVERLKLEAQFDKLSKQATKEQRKSINEVLDIAGKLPAISSYSNQIQLVKFMNEIY